MGSLITREFVDELSSRYRESMKGDEERLLQEDSPRIRDRGYFTRDEFLRVGEWKLNRRGYRRREQATEEEVEALTRCALSAPPGYEMSILALLPGVGRGVASAMLTVWRPDYHTVIDWRAEETLRLDGHFQGMQENRVPYSVYRQTCHGLASELGVHLRDLDRALWQHSLERRGAEK